MKNKDPDGLWAQVAEGGLSVPAQWAASHGGAERMFASMGKKNPMPVHKLKALPKQDNYTDCGLFLLAYLQFFAFSLPEPDQDLHTLMERAHNCGYAAADCLIDGKPLAYSLTSHPASLPAENEFATALRHM